MKGARRLVLKKGEDLILATSCLHSKVAIKAAASMDLGAQGRQSRGFKTKGFRFGVLGLVGDYGIDGIGTTIISDYMVARNTNILWVSLHIFYSSSYMDHSTRSSLMSYSSSNNNNNHNNHPIKTLNPNTLKP